MAPDDRRLVSARGWNLPLPEILCIIGGFAFQRIDPNLTSTLNRLAMVAETAGWSGLIVGIPLLFIPLRVFWLDLAYIVMGLAMYLSMLRFAGEPIIFLGLVAFLGMGMMLAGASYLVRRGGAALLRRDQA